MPIVRKTKVEEHLRSERLTVLRWLTEILQQRFGEFVQLTQNDGQWVSLSIVGNNNKSIRILCDFDTFAQNGSDLPYTRWDAAQENWDPALGSDIPAPGAASLPSPLIERTGLGFSIHYDILGLTYWMLSRREELGRTDLDEHGRFPAVASHAYKHQYLERPIVDEWLNILGQVIKLTWPGLSLREHQFNMRVSHDVDGPSWYSFSTLPQLACTVAADLLVRRKYKRALHAPRIWAQSRKRLHPDDPANTFAWLMDTSERYGLKSAFYFICGRTDAARDARYDPEHPAIRALMRDIHRRGHEIGLHPSYNTFQQPDLIASEARRLATICEEENIELKDWGGRMHFLRWETPTTLYGWEQAGASYESSLSYADRPGFRCGTCFEYPAFDPARCMQLNIRIVPLIAMEVTVIDTHHLGLGTREAAYAKFMQLKNICRAVNGTFTLLWHNSELDTPERKALYESLLA